MPDLACFGKAMANGFPLAAVVGIRDIMKRFDEVFFAEQELVNYRRSVYTARAHREGKTIGAHYVMALRRPGVAETGILPSRIDELIGARVRRPFPTQSLLLWHYIDSNPERNRG